MKLSRLSSKFDKGFFNMYQFGYAEDDKLGVKVDRIRDYFYYSAEHIDDILDIRQFDCKRTDLYTTLYGDKVYKVYYSAIKAKNELVRKYPDRIHQADVTPEFKFMLDRKLEWSSKRHIMYFDIETWFDPEQPKANMPHKAMMPVTSIVCYSNFHKKYWVISWHPEHTKDFDEPKITEKDNVNYMLCKDEKTVLLSFIELLGIMKTDVLTGWYSAGYDLPYIINRCKRLGLPYENLSPLKDVYIKKRGEYWRINIKGLDHVDMMEAVQDMGYNLPNWKLTTAVKEIIGDEDLDKLTEVTWRDWIDNYKGFIEYGIRDVEILAELDKKIQIFDLYTTLQQIAHTDTLGGTFHKSMVVDNYILKENHGKIVFPTRHTRAKQQYAGAIVFNPREPGRHQDVTVMDYTSLYPTSIMAFNISPETFIVSEKSCKKMGIKIEDVIQKLKDDGIGFIDTGTPKVNGVPELFGERYLFYDHKYKLGLLPQVLRKLFLQRVEVNRALKAGEYTGDEAVAMDKRQQAYKLVLNSAYGAMGFNFFRLYRPECADGITFFARQALKFASLKFQNLDHYVLYGDTDSIFVKSNGKSESEMKETLVEFNDMLRKELVERYNPGIDDDYMQMDLKFEYDLEYIYFGDSKKRYYSIIRDTGKKYIRGMNIIRKDTPEFMKGALNKIAELAVRGTLTMDHLNALRQKIETVDYKLIGINKKFTKSFDQYNKTMPQHVKASFWANEKLNTNITHTDTPLLFYIKSNCEDELKIKQRQQAICLNEEELHLVDERKDVFEIDYETFFNKQVLDQLDEFNKIEDVKNLVETYRKDAKSDK